MLSWRSSVQAALSSGPSALAELSSGTMVRAALFQGSSARAALSSGLEAAGGVRQLGTEMVLLSLLLPVLLRQLMVLPRSSWASALRCSGVVAAPLCSGETPSPSVWSTGAGAACCSSAEGSGVTSSTWSQTWSLKKGNGRARSATCYASMAALWCRVAIISVCES